MKRLIGILSVLLLLLGSCEEVIDVNLNEGDPRYVIEGELTNLSRRQVIRISQTVPFDSDVPSLPIDDAVVEVTSSSGRTYAFTSIGDGRYEHNNMNLNSENSYQLTVRIKGEEFVATERMEQKVAVDSLGILEETVFSDTYYSVLVKFADPIDENNYYKYLVSVNEQPFRFLQVVSDKFNNGLYVTHQLMDFDKPFELGDTVVVRRQSISKPVFDYWNEIQMLNPGSAAPANPQSNISNGAMGYFSISRTDDYGITIREVEDL